MMRVLVTGGASGLGYAITKQLLDSGDYVYFTYLQSNDQATELQAKFPNQCLGLQCDFQSNQSIEALIAAISQWNLDALVNNALPPMHIQQFQKTAIQDFGDSFTSTVLPVLAITQACLTQFRKMRAGRVVNILTSYLLNRPPIGLGAYIANKAYLLAISKTLLAENAKFGITINNISPSIMSTNLVRDIDERIIEMSAKSNLMRRLIRVEEVAQSVEFLLKSTPHINGVNLVLNGGENVL